MANTDIYTTIKILLQFRDPGSLKSPSELLQSLLKSFTLCICEHSHAAWCRRNPGDVWEGGKQTLAQRDQSGAAGRLQRERGSGGQKNFTGSVPNISASCETAARCESASQPGWDGVIEGLSDRLQCQSRRLLRLVMISCDKFKRIATSQLTKSGINSGKIWMRESVGKEAGLVTNVRKQRCSFSIFDYWIVQRS